MTGPSRIEADVLVVGSGAGGMAAAITAAHHGLRVLVAEKSDWFGGCTAVSGGATWIPANHHQASLGLVDDSATALRYLQGIIGQRLPADLVEAFLAHAPAMLRFFESNTDVVYAPRKSPDYESDIEGARWGRTVDPKPFDGRLLGRHFLKLRPPFADFLAFGGLMVGLREVDDLLNSYRDAAAFGRSAALLAQYAVQRLSHPRGTRLIMGNALAARLLSSALRFGVRLEPRASVEALEMKEGRVTGATVLMDGLSAVVNVRRGVVLAAGGIAQDPTWRAESLAFPGDHHSAVPECTVGDGIRLGISAGGTICQDNANPAFLSPVSLLARAAGRPFVFPHLVLDRQKPGVIAVNRAGRRFTNEANSYHRFVEAMHDAGNGGPSIPAFLICDHRTIRRYGLGLARPGPRSHRPLIEAGYLAAGHTLEELAREMSIDPAALAVTVASANSFARRGVDEAFGKGSTEYNRYLGDPRHSPNPCLGPIEKPPFYAIRVWPGDIGSVSGLLTDASARVLAPDGAPIPALYAAGNDMNSIMAGHYPAGGITLGPALTFGYIAGRHLAGIGASGS